MHIEKAQSKNNQLNRDKKSVFIWISSQLLIISTYMTNTNMQNLYFIYRLGIELILRDEWWYKYRKDLILREINGVFLESILKLNLPDNSKIMNLTVVICKQAF